MSKLSTFDRIVVYQPRNGWVCDLGPGSALAPRYNPSEEKFQTAAGTEEPIARRRPLVIPIFDDSKILHLRKMQIEGCEIRALLIGKGSNIVWEFDSGISLVDFGGGKGQVSGTNLELATHVFECSIYQNKDLLAGIPWECQNESGGVFPGPSGYQGNQYTAGSGQSTNAIGNLAGSGTPQLEMYFPLEGLQYTLGGEFTGDMKTLDFSGNTLSTKNKNTVSIDETGTIDDGTWKIQINVTNADGRPTLTVTDAGPLHADRVGGCIDCSDLDAVLGSAPSWSS